MQYTQYQKSRSRRSARGLLIGLLLACRAFSAAPSSVTDFGSVNVNANVSSHTIAFTLSGLTAKPTAVIGAVDFTAGTLSCNSGNTSCTAVVTFSPKSVGLKQDALTLKTASGQVAASAFLHGIGLAPAMRLLPAVISNLAGSGNWTYVDGSLSAAGFRSPQGLAVDLKGNFYVADSVNQVVRKIAPSTSTVSTFAGNGNAGYSGDGGPALSATINTPTGLALDAAGNVFIADQGNRLIRRVDAITGIITTVAGGGNSLANNVAATAASLSGPNNLAIDTAGNLYISDSFHSLIRKVTASSGLIATIAGGGSGSGSDGLGNGALATAAQLSDPTGITLNAAGDIYFADTGHSMVRRVTASTGIIDVIAGSGANGNAGDGGLATSAELNSPTGICLDANGDLHIADFAAQVVRFVNSATGIISTIAGSGVAGHSGDGGFAVGAKLSSPSDAALGATGSLFIADYGNNVIRRIQFLPTALTFPATNINATSSLVAVTLINQGNASLTLSGLTVTGPFREQSAASGECIDTSVISPGAVCHITLVFSPTTGGSASGTLNIQSNDANIAGSLATIALMGTGVSGTPSAGLSVTSLSFPNQAVGSVSAASTVTLSNSGTANLSIGAIELAGANSSDFSISSTNCSSTLARNATCTISLTFSPSRAGTRTATLQISDSAANSPQSVSLSGAGTNGAQPVANVTSLQFAAQLAGTPSSPQTVTLSNAGSATLGITSISVGGVNGLDFSLYSYTCASTLAAAASCNVKVRFTPGAAGARSGALVFAFSGGLPSISIPLSGAGLALPCVTSLTAANHVYLAPGANASIAVSAPTGCSWSLTVNSSWISFSGSSSGSGSASVAFTVSQNTTAQPRVATFAVEALTQTAYQLGVGLRFVPVTPCRVVDTRNPAGPFGGPSLAASTQRDFAISSGPCGIPSTAQSYSLNVAAVPHSGFHYLTIWPAGQAKPLVANLNSVGQVKSNAAIVPAGVNGAVSVYSTDLIDLVLDINGYFVTDLANTNLEFYPLYPCRVIDTRLSAGPFGAPHLSAGIPRDFPFPSSACNIPATAQAYSINLAAVPRTNVFHYLTAWPAGRSQPVVSSLNGNKNKIVANAAIIGAGSNGAISLYSTDDIDIVVDINGYFAPPAAGGLMLYNVVPCRALDTRINPGTEFFGPMTFSLSSCPVPSQVRGYVLQVAAVPSASFRNLSLWPAGTTQPLVATLNDDDAQVTSNLAILPTVNGDISASANIGPTHLVLDMFGIFAP